MKPEMAELFHHDPTDRFSGLAELYARYRPDYPTQAVRHILMRCGLRPGAVLVDVGSGTGIASRLFARQGLYVVGIEPNADMRARAASEPWDGPGPAPEYRAGRAEATGLPAGFADAVLAAQAFHWFAPQAALAEFHRILKPAGWVTLLWNERDESDPFTADYGAVIRGFPGAEVLEGQRIQSGGSPLSGPWFTDCQRDVFHHEQLLTEEEIVGRALSASYAPRELVAVVQATAALQQVFARHQQGGRARLCYQTVVHTGRRTGSL
jgi:SAM-dependent methyltransferase